MDRKQRLNKMPAIDLLADFVLGGVARNINTSHNYWLYYLEGFPLLMKKSILRSFRPTPNFIRIAYLHVSVYCRPRGANSEQLFHMQPAASIYFCLDSSQLVLNPTSTIEHPSPLTSRDFPLGSVSLALLYCCNNICPQDF